MKTNASAKQILTIIETVERAKEAGLPVSQYTLRRAIKSGSLPCRVVGRTYLIAWQNFIRWITCESGQDNIEMPVPAPLGTIRSIDSVMTGR